MHWKFSLLVATAALALPAVAHAQGAIEGSEHGAAVGAHDAGPVAVVAVGAERRAGSCDRKIGAGDDSERAVDRFSQECGPGRTAEVPVC